jgi:release factor glutamine methyltransferase
MNSSKTDLTVSQALKIGTQTLLPVSDSARIDSEILLGFILKKPRTFLFTYPEYLLSPAEEAQFIACIHERMHGKPIAYLIQEREFWSLKLKVSADTLIPRPETELLVERALFHIQDIPHARILDLGTGSGAVALAIAHERPDCQIIATDISPEALTMARLNASELQTQITFLQSNWFSALTQEPFHLIVSNPPYLATNDPHIHLGDLRFEPKHALCSGQDGLEAISTIIEQAPAFLLPRAWLCIEHGYTQKNRIHTLFNQHGYQKVSSFQDLRGHDRITEACCF